MQASTAVLPQSSDSEETCSCAKQVLQHGAMAVALATGEEETVVGLTGAEPE